MAVTESERLHHEANVQLDMDEPFGPPNSPTAAPSSGSSGAVPPLMSLDGSQCTYDRDTVEEHLVRSLSALSMRQLDVENSDAKIITIAISGCSSSGKTTLALILSEILMMEGMSGLASNGTNSSDNKAGKQNLLIHMDNYFLSKGDCPTVEFESSSKQDIDFCLKSIENEGVGEYIILYTGTRANAQHTKYSTSDTSTPPTFATVRSLLYQSDVGDGTGVEAFMPHFKISGPNTVCNPFEHPSPNRAHSKAFIVSQLLRYGKHSAFLLERKLDDSEIF
jgi:hypothetical protein